MKKKLIIAVIVLFVLKCFYAVFMELGNDEAYYYTFAKNLQWSYFDHPVMTALLEYISTLGLRYRAEFFLRFFPLIMGLANTYILYRIVKELEDETTAYIAVVMYISTFYASIISGVFILPDAPLSFFGLLSMGFSFAFIKYARTSYLMGFAVFLALALLSKYQAFFMGLAMALYIIKFAPQEFSRPRIYIAFGIACLGLLPTLIWNLQTHGASFFFHMERVGKAHLFEFFPREILGQIIYQNPIIFGLIVWAMFRYKIVKPSIPHAYRYYLGAFSLPLIFTSVFLSIFTESLPHWSGIAYIGLIVLAAMIFKRTKIPIQWIGSAYLLFIIFTLWGWEEVNYGLISNLQSRNQTIALKGRHDATQDIYGWKQLNTAFSEHLHKKGRASEIIVTRRWYPAGQLEYYVADPNRMEVLVEGPLFESHEYGFKNNELFWKNNNNVAYFIAQSNSRFRPEKNYGNKFEAIPIDTFPILRRKDTIRYHFLYLIKKKP